MQTSLVKRAVDKNLISIDVDSLFSFVKPKERIDGSTFGAGAGMLIRPEVVERAVESKEREHGKSYKIFFSPQGKKLNQNFLKKIYAKASQAGHIMLLPARYEGMDARAEQEYADEIVSVGDFVLMGGDIPAMMLLEGMLRLVPGVVGKAESVIHESFSGPFLDYPSYTQPVVWKGRQVPEIIRSGNHGAVEAWRKEKAIEKTVKSHFYWLASSHLTKEQKASAKKYIPRHYVALMHTDVLIGPEREPGVTSVTTIDIHDIARSSKTYGVESFFIVTPLKDQQKIVHKLLEFWHGDGSTYNKSRHEALASVSVNDSLDGVIHEIQAKEGVRPIVIATSARFVPEAQNITFYEQSRVWADSRPVLILFGTGQGLADSALRKSDFVLLPISGLTEFNHLSVRSAVAIVLDRWLGIHEAELDKKLSE